MVSQAGCRERKTACGKTCWKGCQIMLFFYPSPHIGFKLCWTSGLFLIATNKKLILCIYIYMCRSCTLWLVYSQIKPIWQPAFPLNGSVSNSIIYSVPLISCESPKTRLVCKHSHIHLPSKMHVHWTLFIINFLFLHFIAYYMSSNIVY